MKKEINWNQQIKKGKSNNKIFSMWVGFQKYMKMHKLLKTLSFIKTVETMPLN